MALRILAVFLLVATLAAGRAKAAVQCLACHDPHYVEVGGCVDCHRGDPRSRRLEVAHRDLIGVEYAGFALADDAETAAGLEWIESLACRRCHQLAGSGNPLAVGLDDVFWEARPQEVDQALQQPVAGMPDFAFSRAQRRAVVRALLRSSRQSPRTRVEVPRIVHFDSGEGDRSNPFTEHCAGCHRLLSLRYGALGRGDAAPNLSGLFTPYYPPFAEDQPWDAELLERWVRNPRTLRPGAVMAPLRLRSRDLEGVLRVFGDSPR